MPTAASPRDAAEPELLVACLCAQWCRTCDEYRDKLAQVRDALAAAHPQAAARFVWIDIEDEAELVGDLDIEDFPTVVLARGHEVVFAGPVLPHVQTLARLARGALEGDLPRSAAPWPPEVSALPARLAGRPGI
jgi:thiol-disulfide isomerase/thioredoxin